MEAIETTYKGNVFRSELAARWAVFFDALGIEYRYELEGFDLNGVRHLPDFWLPKQNCWIVVTPNPLKTHSYDPFARDKNIAARCGRLAVATDKNVYLLTGEVDRHWGIVFTIVDDSGDWYEDASQWWCVCRKCEAIDLCFQGSADRIYCRCKASSHSQENQIIERACIAANEACFQ